ncbi:MAG: AAA family ATPase [Armatimonadota bacterium]
MVITLSRQAEAGGEELAELLCERAGLVLADRAALERIARREGLPLAELAIFDEAAGGALRAVVAEWRAPVRRDAYLRNLVQALLLLEREGDTLIMGRGAAFALADPGTLHLRVVAPMPCRVARLVQREGLHRAQARRLLEASDEARARFVRETFSADIADPCHYDMTLSTAELPLEAIAEAVLAAAAIKSSRRWTSPREPRDLVAHVMRFQRQPGLPRVSEEVWRLCDHQVR